MTNTPTHLRLVRSFKDESYPYIATNRLENPYNCTELAMAKFRLRSAVALAGIKDFKLFEHWDRVTLHLRTLEDIEDFKIADTGSDAICRPITIAVQNPSPRILKKRCKQVSESLNKTSLAGRFEIMPLVDAYGIAVLTYDKPAYFTLKRMKPEEFILGFDYL